MVRPIDTNSTVLDCISESSNIEDGEQGCQWEYTPFIRKFHNLCGRCGLDRTWEYWCVQQNMRNFGPVVIAKKITPGIQMNNLSVSCFNP